LLIHLLWFLHNLSTIFAECCSEWWDHCIVLCTWIQHLDSVEHFTVRFLLMKNVLYVLCYILIINQ
jgi:hypothetical protein